MGLYTGMGGTPLIFEIRGIRSEIGFLPPKIPRGEDSYTAFTYPIMRKTQPKED